MPPFIRAWQCGCGITTELLYREVGEVECYILNTLPPYLWKDVAQYLTVGAGAVDGVLEHPERGEELGVLPQDLQLRHLRVLVLVGVFVLPLHAPDLDELAALAGRDDEPVARRVEDVDGLVVILAGPAVAPGACEEKP